MVNVQFMWNVREAGLVEGTSLKAVKHMDA